MKSAVKEAVEALLFWMPVVAYRGWHQELTGITGLVLLRAADGCCPLVALAEELIGEGRPPCVGSANYIWAREMLVGQGSATTPLFEAVELIIVAADNTGGALRKRLEQSLGMQ